MRFKRALSVLVLFLGFIGFVGCLAAIIGVWVGGARLRQVTDNLFGQIDHSFVVVRERIARTAERVQSSKITAESIERSLRDWAKKAAGQRLVSRADVKEKAERLADILGQADHWMELSASSTEMVREVLSIRSSGSAPANTESADRLLEEIGALRSHLAQAKDLAERIGGLRAEAGGEKTLDERIYQGTQLAIRLLATLSSIDTRLEKLAAKVCDMQERVRHWQAITLRWIRIIAICTSLLLAWMAAGQSLLGLHGWRAVRKSRRRPSSKDGPSLRSPEKGNA